MATRSLNKVLLIGNVVRDPETRYTPQNNAICNFSIATNRSWTGSDGTVQESTEFTRVVTFGKQAEIAEKLLRKGRKVYVEGRLQTRTWQDKENQERKTVEVVADQFILLDSPRGRDGGESSGSDYSYPEADAKNNEAKESESLAVNDQVSSLDDLADDIPF